MFYENREDEEVDDLHNLSSSRWRCESRNGETRLVELI
jgi:hypothetical protein